MPLYPPPSATGIGDVVGPASSVDNVIPLFSGTTGKLLKSSVTLTSASGTLTTTGGITGTTLSLTASDIIMSGSGGIRITPSAGSHIFYAYITGGGGSSLNGASIRTYGNSGAEPGDVYLETGQTASGGRIRFIVNNVERGRMHYSGGFSWGDTADPGAGNFRVAGTTTLVGTVTGGTYNGQTISSAANFTGSIIIAGATTVGGELDVTGGSGTSYATASIEIRSAATPRISFHWPAVVASQIGMDSAGTIRTYDNPGTGYAPFAAGAISGASTITAGTTITAGGIITSNGYGGVFTSTASPTTDWRGMVLANSGNVMYVAVDNSSAGVFGVNAYAATIYCGAAPGINIQANAGPVRILSSNYIRIYAFAGTGASGGVSIGDTHIDPGSRNLHVSYLTFPGNVNTGTGQVTYYISFHSSYGLFTNTGFYAAGSMWSTGPLTASSTLNVAGLSTLAGITCNSTFTLAVGVVMQQGPFSNGSAFLYSLNGAMAFGVAGASGSLNSFWTSSGQAGVISVSGATTNYGVSSDIRLKRDLGLLTDTSVLRNIKIHEYEWIYDNKPGKGVFAQEAYEIAPYAVIIGNDELKEGKLKNPWNVDYSKFVPDLIVGWQSHDSRIKMLEEQIERLENRV